MTSLAEVYEGGSWRGYRRLSLGAGLFAGGAVMVVVGILLAATRVGAPLGLRVVEARELAGVFAGLGVPAVFLGIFTVLPADPRQRAAAVVGAGTAAAGVALFGYAYPERWIGVTPDHLTLPVVAVYFLGTLITFWALFVAVVDFKAREPGGTVTLQRIIERATGPDAGEPRPGGTPSGSGSSFGGVGVVGNVDRDPVMRSDRGSAAASDGGTGGQELRTPGGADATPADGPTADPDRYCGNCAYFDYERTADGIQPYCGYYDELMDDVEPCEHWQANSGPR